MNDRAARHFWDDMMRASLSGDKSAYRLLLASVMSYIRLVVRRASRQGSGAGGFDVEDIVQEALPSVHPKRHMRDPSLSLWLGAIARHKTSDAFRRLGGRVMVSVEDFAQMLAEPVRAESGLGDAERLLAILTERERRIVRAIKMDEHSAAGVGRELNMTAGVVRVALHRAQKSLSELFGKTKT